MIKKKSGEILLHMIISIILKRQKTIAGGDVEGFITLPIPRLVLYAP